MRTKVSPKCHCKHPKLQRLHKIMHYRLLMVSSQIIPAVNRRGKRTQQLKVQWKKCIKQKLVNILNWTHLKQQHVWYASIACSMCMKQSIASNPYQPKRRLPFVHPVNTIQKPANKYFRQREKFYKNLHSHLRSNFIVNYVLYRKVKVFLKS